MPKANPRAKGARGELEFAALLREFGYHTAKRGQQFKGGAESPDVDGVPGVHFEVKRTEALRLYDAVDQARRDAGGKAVPIVAHRCNGARHRTTCRGDWLFVLGAEDFFRLLARGGLGPPAFEDFL